MIHVSLSPMSGLVAAVSIVSLFGYYHLLRSRTQIVPLAIPYVIFSGITVVTYAFGVAGHLRAGVSTVVTFGILSIIYSILRPNSSSGRSFSVPEAGAILALLGFAFIAYLVAPNDFAFVGWDELSHWALSSKVMYMNGELVTKSSAVTFKGYPPGASLFQYFWMVCFGYSEINQLFAQILLIWATIIAVIGFFVGRDYILAAVGSVIVIVVMSLFGLKVASVDVDALVAVSFAALMAFALQPRVSMSVFVAFCTCLGSFVLLKQVSVPFALIIIVALCGTTFSEAFANRRDGQSYAFSRPIAFAVISIIVVLLINHSWSSHVRSIGAAAELALPSIDQVMSEPMVHRIGATFAQFISKFFGWNTIQAGMLIDLPMLTAFWATTILLVGSFFAWALVAKDAGMRSAVALLALIGGCVCYIGLLLFLYLVHFAEWEGVQLAAFDRYYNTYLVAWAVVVIGLILHWGKEVFRGKFRYVVGALLLACAVLITPKNLIPDEMSRAEYAQKREVREHLEKLAVIAQQRVDGADQIFFVSQGSKGYESYMFNYLVAPKKAQWGCWSLGEKYDNDDVWSCKVSMEEIAKGFKVLVLGTADDRFWHDYGQYFEPSDVGASSGVFEVSKASGTVKLRRVSVDQSGRTVGHLY